MDQLGDGDGPIDIHAHRHGLKLHKETRETSHWENKKGYACPACGNEFAQLFVTEKEHNSFDPATSRPFCLRREDDRLLLFRH